MEIILFLDIGKRRRKVCAWREYYCYVSFDRKPCVKIIFFKIFILCFSVLSSIRKMS